MTKKNSKKKISNWRLWVAGLLFIIAGLLFAAGPIRSYMLAQFQQEHTQQLSKVTAAEVKENETQEAEFDFSTVEPLDLQASHRYSFKGKFISKTQISDVTEDVKQAFNIDFTTL